MINLEPFMWVIFALIWTFVIIAMIYNYRNKLIEVSFVALCGIIAGVCMTAYIIMELWGCTVGRWTGGE